MYHIFSWFDRRFLALPLLFPPFYFQYFCDIVPGGELITTMYAAICFVLLRQRLRPLLANKVFLGLVCFAAYICIQYFLCIDKNTYGKKLYLFLGHGLTYFVAGTILNSERSIFKVAHVSLFLLLFVRTIIVLSMFFSINWSYDDVLSGSGYQIFAHYIALGLLVYVPFLFDGGHRIVKLLILITMIVSLFMTGGTGGIVALFLTLSLWAVVWRLGYPGRRSSIAKYAASVVLASALLLAISTTIGTIPYSLTTIAKKTSNLIVYILHPERLSADQQREDSVLERWKLFKNTIPIVKHHFLIGVGFGCWRPAVERSTFSQIIYEYPHNIVLELLSETGIVGLVLFAIAVFFAFVPLGEMLDPRVFVAKVGLTYWLVVHCISGDLTDSWLFLFLGLASVAVSGEVTTLAQNHCETPA